MIFSHYTRAMCFIFRLAFLSHNVKAQKDLLGAKQTIMAFFSKMNTSDTAGLRILFAQDAVLQSLDVNDKRVFK